MYRVFNISFHVVKYEQRFRDDRLNLIFQILSIAFSIYQGRMKRRVLNLYKHSDEIILTRKQAVT